MQNGLNSEALQQLEADGEQPSATAVGREAKGVRIRTKPRGSTCSRKRRRNSSADRLIRFLLMPYRGPPTEANLVIVECDESVVRDRDPMRIGAELAQNALRTFKGTLGVDDPVMAEQSSQP